MRSCNWARRRRRAQPARHQIELYEGLTARSVNGWPSVDFHLMSAVGLAGGLTPAGFYYKTFMWPKRLWMAYEHFIRKAAGLGTAPAQADPDIYDTFNQHCDVLIVGAGPAGLAAAEASAKTGARVILADEQNELGGSLLADGQTIDGEPAPVWAEGAVARLRALDNVELLPRSTVFGYYDHNFLGIVQRRTDHRRLTAQSGAPRQRLHRVRARQVILATGAIERPLVFGNNDVPGVMLAGAVRTYLNRYGVAAGAVWSCLPAMIRPIARPSTGISPGSMWPPWWIPDSIRAGNCHRPHGRSASRSLTVMGCLRSTAKNVSRGLKSPR